MTVLALFSPKRQRSISKRDITQLDIITCSNTIYNVNECFIFSLFITIHIYIILLTSMFQNSYRFRYVVMIIAMLVFRIRYAYFVCIYFHS